MSSIFLAETASMVCRINFLSACLNMDKSFEEFPVLLFL